MTRRTHTSRTISAAKLCVALIGMAAIPTFAIAQTAAKADPAKPSEKPAIKVIADTKVTTEKELNALKAEMDVLKARFSQLQAEKAAQLAELTAKQEAAKAQAIKVGEQIKEAKIAEQQALEKLANRREDARKNSADEQRIVELKLQLEKAAAAHKVASEQEKEAIAARIAHIAKLKADTEKNPASGVKTEEKKVLKAGSPGVKVIGADGKEIPGVIVIIDKSGSEKAPETKATRLTLTPGTNGEVTGSIRLTPAEAPKAPKVVEGKPALPALPALPTAPKPPVAPQAPAAPIEVKGLQLLVEPTAKAPAPTKTTANFTINTTGVMSANAASNAIALSRATYKLPKDQAASLAGLLGGIKSLVMEIKLEGDTLVVTTTPEAQKDIAAFVRLITGGGVKFSFSMPLENGVSSAPAAIAVPGMKVENVQGFKSQDTLTTVNVLKSGDIVPFVKPLQSNDQIYGTMFVDVAPNSNEKTVTIRGTNEAGKFVVENVNVNGPVPTYANPTTPANERQNFLIQTVNTPKVAVQKAEEKKIRVIAKEENGKVTVETVDVTGEKPQIVEVRTLGNGDKKAVNVSEGKGQSATIELKEVNLADVIKLLEEANKAKTASQKK